MQLPGFAVHDPEDIELSILKQRLARRLRAEGHTDESVVNLDLVGLTNVRANSALSRPHKNAADR